MRYLYLYIFCLFLSGCATLTAPQLNPPHNQKITWISRESALKQIKQFEITGLLGINMPNNNVTANVNWQQKNKNYIIHFWGPFNIGATKIVGTQNQVMLTQPDSKTITAKTPEILIEQELGWILPVSHLRYWILGLPAPHFPSQKTWDLYHHLKTLKQDGWTIEYQNYTGIQKWDLPQKMTLRRPNLEIRLVISTWLIGSKNQ